MNRWPGMNNRGGTNKERADQFLKSPGNSGK